jgi:hypothetical protein
MILLAAMFPTMRTSESPFSQPEGHPLTLVDGGVDETLDETVPECGPGRYYEGTLAIPGCIMKPWWYDQCKTSEVWSESGKMCIERPWSDFVECVFEVEQGGEGCDDNHWVKQHCNETCAVFSADREYIVRNIPEQCYAPNGTSFGQPDPTSGVAFLFLVGSSWPQQLIWEKFLAPIQHQVKLFVHSNVPISSGLSTMFPDAHIKDTTPCDWGELVQCIMLLLEHALKDPNTKRMVFLGPRTIPLKKPLELLSSIRSGASRSRFCFFPPNHHSVLDGATDTHNAALKDKKAIIFKAQAWFTLARRHAETIVAHLESAQNSVSPSHRQFMCRKQRIQCKGAPDECCFVRILQETGVLNEVEDRCDMFIWWRDDEFKLTQQTSANTCITELGVVSSDADIGDFTMSVPIPCALPQWCNISLFKQAAKGLLADKKMSGHLQASPRVFYHASKEAIENLISSPFLYARKFDQSDELNQLLTSLLEL